MTQTCEAPSPLHVFSRLAAWCSKLSRSHDEVQLETDTVRKKKRNVDSSSEILWWRYGRASVRVVIAGDSKISKIHLHTENLCRDNSALVQPYGMKSTCDFKLHDNSINLRLHRCQLLLIRSAHTQTQDPKGACP
jgi:hypothetical protein